MLQSGILSVNLPGASLHNSGERLQVRRPDHSIAEEIPFFRIHGIWLFGPVEVTSSVIRRCLQNGPCIHYLTQMGSHRGLIGPMTSDRAVLRLKQYHQVLVPKKRFEMARALVKAKLRVQIDIYKNWGRSRRMKMADVVSRLETAEEALMNVRGVDDLLGFEGIAAKAWFEGYARFFTHDHGFAGRNRRPPRDPINALLSLGYTFLLTEILAATGLVDLDPYLGCLHKPFRRRPSLALDLIEPFRVVVDELVLTRLNLMIFKNSDFVVGENGGVKLTPETFPRFVKEFGDRMARPFPTMPDGSKTVRELMRAQARRFKDALLKKTIFDADPRAEKI